MPSRILKESWLTSQTIDRLTPEEECLAVRLLDYLDDYGWGQADPCLVLAGCFPRKIGRLTPSHIGTWLDGLVRAELVELFCDKNGVLWMHWVRWREHNKPRASKSKCALEYDRKGARRVDSCMQMLADVDSCMQMSPVPVFVFEPVVEPVVEPGISNPIDQPTTYLHAGVNQTRETEIGRSVGRSAETAQHAAPFTQLLALWPVARIGPLEQAGAAFGELEVGEQVMAPERAREWLRHAVVRCRTPEDMLPLLQNWLRKRRWLDPGLTLGTGKLCPECSAPIDAHAVLCAACAAACYGRASPHGAAVCAVTVSDEAEVDREQRH